MSKQRDNSGALFVNEKRLEQKEGAPNATGTAMVGGIMYRLSAWTNTDANGKKYQSIRFQVQEAGDPGTKPDKSADAGLDKPF